MSFRSPRNWRKGLSPAKATSPRTIELRRNFKRTRRRRLTDSNHRLGELPPGQFRIFKADSSHAMQSTRSGAKRVQIDSYIIEYNDPLLTTMLKDVSGNVIGVVLGQAFIADNGARLSSKNFEAVRIEGHTQEDFDSLYSELFGSFIIIVMVDRKAYIYLDAGGCLSAVYSKDLAIAGSTAAAILSPAGYESRFRKDLYVELDVVREGWFPSGTHGASRRVATALQPSPRA